MATRPSQRRLYWIPLAFACMLANGRALAQLSFPYDPDFPEEQPPAAAEARPGAPERAPRAGEARPAPKTPPALPVWMRRAGPFMLLDRPDPVRLFETEPSTAAPREFEDFLLEQRPFRIDQRAWNRMREDYERGRLPSEEFAPAPMLEPEAIPMAAEPPKPPPPEVELPTYGTSLSITGRKVIGFSYSQKRFLRDQRTTGRPKSTSLIDIQQQLQLRMQGKVGPKITVNVDYDDTKTNKQDISIVYTGESNEVVQNASFGDIDLSLPATEFVSYNKQLFGIRVDIKWKRMHAIFIGSRTKGTTKSRQFAGNTQFVTQDILDINYIRRRYYDLSFGDPARLPLRVGSERVWLSRRTGGQQNVDEFTLTADDLNVRSSTFTGTFVQLSPGQDYIVDYVTGTITFKNTLDPSYVVAVDFIDATGNSIALQVSTNTADGVGGTGNLKLIKTFADAVIAGSSITTVNNEAGYRRELKTYYSMGRSQIVRDDGRGNFFLRVLDQNRQEVGSLINPQQIYPDTIEVDFENGLFSLRAPFGTSLTDPTPDPEIYAPNPLTKRRIQVEYRFRLKTFFLEPSLVLQSEVILLDGVRLNRNVDYFIDYESGFLTFFNEERIRPDSVIDVTYEVAPFAGAATESLLGGRFSVDILKNWSMGSTLLYQTGAKPPTVPSVNELAKSLLVYELDTQLKDLRLLRWLTASFQGELAQSIANPNLSKRALIDNMEGVKQEDSTSLFATNWQIAANPTQGPADPVTDLTISDFDEDILAINPGAPATEGDTQKVLKAAYNFAASGSTEVSVVHVFSPTGLDFSQKTLLEVTLKQTNHSNNEIRFHLGGIDEDSDGDAIYDSEDLGKDLLPSTYDEGELDRILQPEEDVGYFYNPAGKNALRFGADNGRIDSEDLNQNGRLDPADFSGDKYGYQSDHPELFDATSGSTVTYLDFDGSQYHTFQIPLDITTATLSNFLAIKQLRISIRQRPGGTAAGAIQFARIAVVGNSWQRGQAGDPSTGATKKADEELIVTAVNNVDNTEYFGRAIFSSPGDAQQVFSDLYGSLDELQQQSNSNNVSEQALSLGYKDLSAGTTVYTKRVFARAIDISQHENFNFLLYGNADTGAQDLSGEKVFFLRAGSDRDYFEIQVPINFTGWKKVTAYQLDRNNDQVPDAWVLGGGPAGTVAFSTGTPNLQQIGTLVAGLYSTSTSTVKDTGSIYLNEIHLTDPIIRKGTAQKLQADFQVPGWASFGGKYRFVDRNYQTPTTLVANQDNFQQTAYMNFTRIRFFPMNFNLAYSKITTPNTNATGNLSNTVSLLQQGAVRTWNGTATGNLQLGAWPRANLGYERNRIQYDEVSSRLDDRETYKSVLSYGVPWKNPLLPRTIDVDLKHSQYSVSFKSLQARLTPGNFDTDEYSVGYGVKMAFEPWQGSNFSPNYSLTRVREDRSDLTSGTEARKHYPKSLTQNAGFNSAWQLTRWLKPSVSYSITTIENNILNPSTLTISGAPVFFDIGEIKTINRTANGNVSLTLNAAEIVPKSKLLRSFSLTNGYQLQDGDVWNNVEKGLDTKFDVWLRTPLKPANLAAQRVNLTLRDTMNSTQRWSPLEAYDLKGRKTSLKTLALTNNYVKSIQRSETTGTPSKTISTTLPDMIASISQLEQLTYTESWMKNLQMNLKYAVRMTLNVGVSEESNDTFGTDLRSIIKELFDTSLSFNLRTTERKDLRIGQVTQTTDHKDATLQTTFDVRKFRFTPKVDYQRDTTEIGTGAKTQDTLVLTPSLLIRADLNLPQGLYIPFAKKTLKFTNRIIWTTTSSLALRKSPVTIADNSRIFNLNTNADYELARNLRMTINGAISRLWHKFLKEDDYLSYQFATTLTFQF
ncbi:MAG: hypothetical protein ABII00_10840 [Elusimicrobiota bacterium]